MISHQIRSEKAGKIKEGGVKKKKKHAHTQLPADLLLFFRLRSLERTPASHLSSLGNSGAPRAAILEASAGTASHKREFLRG